MKKTEKFASLNLGMQTVSMAVFQSSGDGVPVLRGFSSADLVPDPAADASRSSQLAVVLGELKAKLAWHGAGCGCSIPSQGVFTRFVQLPPVPADQVDQVVLFEAQQNVPYPIDEVVWGYQMLPPREGENPGSLIVATKTDVLESTMTALEAAKLRPRILETSPTALYNAFRFNYPDADGCSLLIDIGARATNLVFIEGEHFFIRTLPIGGSSITAALHKVLDTRTYNEVETMKRTEGMIPPAGAYEGGASAEAAEAGKVARTVMTRIHNEVTRSITFYRTSQRGSAPARVLLAGGGVSMPYSVEFFQEKLSLPVEYFNPFRRVGVAPGIDAGLLARSAHLLGECVGLALRQSGDSCPVALNLRPPSLQRALADEKRRPFLVAAAAALIASIALVGFHFSRSASFLQQVNETMQTQLQPLQEMQERIAAASGERDRLLAESADLAALPVLRTGWSVLLHELNQRQPAKFLWVTKLSPFPAVPGFEAGDGAAKAAGESASPAESEPGGKAPSVTALAIEGLYLENENGPGVVDDFVNALAQSPLFDIKEENKSEVVQVRATQTGDRWAYDYKLIIPLKRPIPL